MANTAYQSTHTGAQIDEAATKVLTTGEIAKMVRDEVKAQLSAISSGTPDIPVFDGDVLKYMAFANFAAAIGNSTFSTGGPSASGELVATFKQSGVWTISNGTTRGFPENAGILAVFCAGSASSYVRFYLFYGLGLGNLYYASVWGGSTLQTAWTKLN